MIGHENDLNIIINEKNCFQELDEELMFKYIHDTIAHRHTIMNKDKQL